MKKYLVTLANSQQYHFLAEDADHAREQAENAEPDNPVTSVVHVTPQIVLVGNIFEGYEFVGPFDEHEDAFIWGETHAKGEWLVAFLVNPEAWMCDYWLPNRSKCSAIASITTTNEYGAPLRFCTKHWRDNKAGIQAQYGQSVRASELRTADG